MKNRSLKEHIFFTLTLAITIPLALSIFFSIRTYREGFLNQFESNTGLILTTAKKMFYQKGENLVKRCRILGNSNELKEILESKDNFRGVKLLSNIESDFELESFIYDENGEILARVPEVYRKRKKTIPDDIFKTSEAGYRIDLINEELILTAFCPVNELTQTTGFIVLKSIIDSHFLSEITAITGGELIISTDDKIISSDHDMEKNEIINKLRKTEIQNDRKSFTSRIGNNRYVFTVEKITDFSLKLKFVSGINVDAFHTMFMKTSYMIILSGFVGLIFAFIVSGFLSSKIVNSMEELVEVSEEMSSGGLKRDIELKDSGISEVNILLKSFLHMHHSIRQSFQIITSTNIKLDERLREISLLNKLNSMIAEIQDHEKILFEVLKNIAETMKVDKASILVMDKRRELYIKEVFPRYDGSNFKPAPANIKWGEGISGIAVAEKRIITSNSGSDDPRYTINRKDQKIKNIIAVPLLADNMSFGVLNLVNKHDGDFTESDVSLLKSVSHPVSVALSKVILNEVAITDGMTGLYLKRYFEARLEEEVKRSKRYGNEMSVIFCDIDHFKSVNDTHGHQVGDEVIKIFADRIKQSVRMDVDIPGRLGGEEFAVILPMDGSKGAMILADRIWSSVRNTPFNIGELSLEIRVSIGVATLPDHATTSDELLGNADKALYISKTTGRDQVTLYSKEIMDEEKV